MTETDPRQTVFADATKMPTSGTVFVHMILFQMYEGVTVGVRDVALCLMVQMAQAASGVLKYTMAESQDNRKGIILSEYMVFESEKAFVAFKATVAHVNFASFIRECADWKISDYFAAAGVA